MLFISNPNLDKKDFFHYIQEKNLNKTSSADFKKKLIRAENSIPRRSASRHDGFVVSL